MIAGVKACWVDSGSAKAYIIRPPSRLVHLGAMDHSTSPVTAELVVLDAPPSRSSKPSRPSSLLLTVHSNHPNEKATSSAQLYPLASSSSQTARWSPYLDSTPPTVHSYPASSQSVQRSSYYPSPSSAPCCSGVPARFRPWYPIILYATTSFAFILAIAFYKNELFQFLDDLSFWLRSDENYGHLVLFFLIFLTTIPPVPLYSTLIVLSGYTFGALTGAVISYCAALSGAVVVFVLSRSLLRDYIEQWLNSIARVRRVIRAIEKRPKLLFLIRLAPYPYNVMNCLLAASPTLTLQTYTICTALSLFKVIIHTYIGASIHSFKTYHISNSSNTANATDWVAQLCTIIGVSLCIAVLVYLATVARKAIDEELDDSPITARDTATRAFLSGVNQDLESAHPYRERPMAEIPFGTLQVAPQ